MPRFTFEDMTLNELPTDFVRTAFPAGPVAAFEVRERSGVNVAEFAFPPDVMRTGGNVSSKTVWEWRGDEESEQNIAATFAVTNAVTGQLAVNLVSRSNGAGAAANSGYLLVFRANEARLHLYRIDRVLAGDTELVDTGAGSAIADGTYVMTLSVFEQGSGTRCVASVATAAGSDVASFTLLDTNSARPTSGYAGVSSGQFNTTTLAMPTVWFERIDINYTPVAAQAADDRLRSSVSETTGSLLDAVDVRAVDASVSEAYT